jgi:outer membrane protein assembly factor BamB
MLRVLIVLLTSVLVAGCSGWFGSKEAKPLPGKRISVLSLKTSLEPDPKLSDLAVRLPRPYKNQNWAQAGGTPSHAMHHLSAPGGLGKVWEVDIGDGTDGDAQLITAPVISNGRIYTMDVDAEVQALDAASGKTIWRVSVAPKDEDDGTLGGGLAVANGKLFITTGFAQVIALDVGNGKVLWRRTLNGPIRAAPTVFRGRVFAVTIANELHALNDSDGKTLWTHIGITETAGLLGGAAPAAAGSVVVSSFSSGEIFALRIENGRVIWSDSLTAIRRSSPLSTLAHIRGRPVIDRGQVIVTANSGRTVAINLRTGARVWEKRVGAGNGPWVAGEFIYVLSAFGELICLSRRTGGVRWVTQLQRYEDEKDQEDPVFWTGPVLAGDRLLIGGSHEEVWSISPYTGRILGRVKVSGPVFIPPVVANDTVYILSDDAKLIALR